MTEIIDSLLNGGGGRGIRTLETVTRLHAFQACAFDHSATPPARPVYRRLAGIARAHCTTRPCALTMGQSVKRQELHDDPLRVPLPWLLAAGRRACRRHHRCFQVDRGVVAGHHTLRAALPAAGADPGDLRSQSFSVICGRSRRRTDQKPPGPLPSGGPSRPRRPSGLPRARPIPGRGP